MPSLRSGSKAGREKIEEGCCWTGRKDAQHIVGEREKEGGDGEMKNEEEKEDKDKKKDIN